MRYSTFKTRAADRHTRAHSARHAHCNPGNLRGGMLLELVLVRCVSATFLQKASCGRDGGAVWSKNNVTQRLQIYHLACPPMANLLLLWAPTSCPSRAVRYPVARAH